MTPRWQTDEQLDAELVDFLTHEAASVRGLPGSTEMARRIESNLRPWRPARLLGRLELLAAGAAVIALVVGLAWLRGQAPLQVGSTPAPPSPSEHPVGSPDGDLLTQVRARGALRLAIRPDFPQAMITGLEGFDVDVGRQLATRLALTGDPIQLTADEILSGTGDDLWDLGMPSALLSTEQAARFVSTDAYYYWPVRLLVPVGSSAASVADLTGKTICVVAGSSGEQWLAGNPPDSALSVVSAPASVDTQTDATDRDCLDAVSQGDADALVTATLSDSDLAARPSFRTVGGPLFTEPRTVVAARAGPDPSALVSAIDDALGAMRSDGTLADLSRNRFGGGDLTTPPGT
jgi:polar amino acid transport system substrate-binding protein